jgi:hypothetical protein
LFEIGWQFGIWGCAAYVIGIAQASVDVSFDLCYKKTTINMVLA